MQTPGILETLWLLISCLLLASMGLHDGTLVKGRLWVRGAKVLQESVSGSIRSLALAVHRRVFRMLSRRVLSFAGR
jgi:hypothetical protein